MGCEEIAALASEKLNLVINVKQTEDTIVVYQKSQLGFTKRTLMIGVEMIEPEAQFERRVHTKVTADSINVETTFKNGTLSDTRTFVNPSLIKQVLVLSLKSSNPVTTVRYLKKVGDFDQDLENQSASTFA